MGVHLLKRALYNMQSKLIDKEACKSITDEVKIREFLNEIPDVFKKSITPHLTNDMSYSYIITKSERL